MTSKVASRTVRAGTPTDVARIASSAAVTVCERVVIDADPTARQVRIVFACRTDMPRRARCRTDPPERRLRPVARARAGGDSRVRRRATASSRSARSPAPTGFTRATARRFLLTLSELGVRERPPTAASRCVRAGARARLFVPVEPRPAGAGAAAHGALGGAGQRVLLDLGARRHRHRLRGAGADPADHEHHAVGRHAAARLLHVNGSRIARRPAGARARAAAGADRAAPADTADVTDAGALRQLLVRVRRQGYALTDQELEKGLRSIAVPIRQRRLGRRGTERVRPREPRLGRGAAPRRPAAGAPDGHSDRGGPRGTGIVTEARSLLPES